MKKLLADEMQETESGRRSPSIIANLMGLDWLPAQHNASKQHKRLSDDYRKKCNSGGFVRSGKENDGRSHMKHGKGQQKCGDVFEVNERSNTETGSITSRAASFRNDSDEDKVAFVRHKFIDAKRFSTDEKLRHSKEFHDALEVLDSNKDLSIKFLQESDSLFTKHLHHLHGAREAHCRCVEGLESLSTLKCNVDVVGYHSGRESSRKIDISHSGNSRHNVGLHKFPEEERDNRTSIATRIVVLKPNLGKARNTVKSDSSTTPSCDFVSDSEFHNGCSNKMQLRYEIMGKGSKHDDPDFGGIKSRKYRKLARDVGRQMKNRLGVDSFNVSTSGCKGYSADESSSDISENNSSYESDVTAVGSMTSLNRGTHNKASTSASASASTSASASASTLASPHIESSISREAKKRLSKRWKMTHNSQEVGPPVKGSTLAEMLAIPDVDVRPHYSDYVAAWDEHFHKFGRDCGTTETTTLFGISNRDGWKDGSVWNSSRSRSLSASLSKHGSPKSSTRHEKITAERFLVCTRSMDSGKNKALKGDSERKDGSFSESTRSRNKDYQSTCVKIIDDREVPFSVNMITSSFDGKASPDVNSEITSCEHVPLNAVVDTENKSFSKSLNYPDELVFASTVQSSSLPPDDRFNYDVSSVQQGLSSSYDVENSSCLQFSATQAKSPTSSKESEKLSPVSVLEATFVAEVSSGSECFERVSAELHGLRMQLQLLKQESEVYDEGSTLISSVECDEESTEQDDGKGLHCVVSSWESSYLIDVLTYPGLDESDLDVSLKTWHSPHCPICPSVFDNLEKKYNGWKPCLRSERKMLFDRINAGIIQIFSQYIDVGPRLKLFRNVSRQWQKNGLKTELHYLLKNHEKVAIRNVMDEAAILGEMQWFKLGDHLDGVGRDIERSLIDELAAELVFVE